MSKINRFDLVNAGIVQRELTDAIRGVCDAHGLVLNLTQARFDNDEFRVALTVKTDKAVDETAGGRAFKLYASGYGLDPGLLDKVVISKGKRLRVVGWSPSRPKYAIDLIELGTNKSWKMPVSHLKSIAHTARAA